MMMTMRNIGASVLTNLDTDIHSTSVSAGGQTAVSTRTDWSKAGSRRWLAHSSQHARQPSALISFGRNSFCSQRFTSGGSLKSSSEA